MAQYQTSRRSLLTAALAAPVAAVGVPLVTAAPAAAAEPTDGCQTVVAWTDITLDPSVTPEAGSPFQARVIRLAGTEFLQLRGVLTCPTPLTADQVIGTLPPSIRPPKTTRGTATRNNHDGINAIRVEAQTTGLIKVFGPTSANSATWIQLDSFSSVMR
ncbi:hypothetical protein [Streptomyces exfoliatus]|uniref:hypothetical protein n=1 Tax=Streptomyces exfoliatus TaxID=1905 RepID=UPI000464B8B3|nr:hypothetical protein [Streptomyces exfoliatus]